MSTAKKPDYILNMEAKFKLLLQHFENIALNIFEWKNLPDGISGFYIEKKLFEKGSVFFYNSEKTSGLMCLPFDNSDKLNVYEEPKKVIVKGNNFYENVEIEKGVIIKNNPLKISTMQEVMFWIEQMTDTLSSFQVNLNHSKTPYIISGSKEQVLTLKNLLEQITGNSNSIVVDKSISDLASLDLKQTGVMYIGDKLLDAYDRLEDKLLTYLGINNTNTTKRERLVVDEVNSNNDEIENNLDTFLTERKNAVEQINKMFNLNIEVNINQSYVKQMKDKVSRETQEQDLEKDGNENE